MPATDMLPKPLGKKIQITAYTDSDHAHDVVTRRSVTGVLLFLNNTSVKAIFQRQKTVETFTYGSELVATSVATKLILEYRNTLHLMGVEPDGPALLLGDNKSVVLNCTMPHALLKKKHAACNYHRVRETITGGAMVFSHNPLLSTIMLTSSPSHCQDHHSGTSPNHCCLGYLRRTRNPTCMTM